MAKLTLNADAETIEKAKRLAGTLQTRITPRGVATNESSKKEHVRISEDDAGGTREGTRAAQDAPAALACAAAL